MSYLKKEGSELARRPSSKFKKSPMNKRACPLNAFEEGKDSNMNMDLGQISSEFSLEQEDDDLMPANEFMPHNKVSQIRRLRWC